MNLEELIKELETSIVKYEKLRDVCNFYYGKGNKIIDIGGNYPIYGSYGIVGYTNEYNNENSVIISHIGASAGRVVWGEGKHFVTYNGTICKTKENIILSRYLFYILLNLKLYKLVKGSQPYLSISDFDNIEIPIPSLELQKEIVRVLDSFTTHLEELKARKQQYEWYRDRLLTEKGFNHYASEINNISVEIEKRQQQYEYYRDKLLSFENKDYVRETTLGEIGEFIRGNGLQKKDLLDIGKPAIHYGQLYTKYGFTAEESISKVSEEMYNKLRRAKCNDILLATTSENEEDICKSTVWLGKEDVAISGDMYIYRTNENPKYISYYLQTELFKKQKEKKLTGTKIIRIHSEDLEKIKIILPDIRIQNKVVEILDKFQLMVEDVKGLLPEEIEKRVKQYEYYRENAY